jgi:imidazolonepropionase-like amidohydrolase
MARRLGSPGAFAPRLKALFIAIGAALGALPAAAAPPSSILIADAVVIDGSGAPARPATDILIRGGLIVAIGPHLARPPGARILEARGKYVVPGLIDAHVHLEFPMLASLAPDEERQIVEESPRAFLYNGVTTVLDAGALLPFILKEADDQRRGRIQGPRIFTLGTPFTPEGGWGSRHGFGVKDAAAARARARAELALGVSGLKLMVRDASPDESGAFEMPPEMLEAILAEARAAKARIYVHALSLSEFREAVGFSAFALMHGLGDPLPPGDPLFQTLAERGVPVVPTISLFQSFLAPAPWAGQGLEDPILRASVPTFVLERMKSPAFMEAEKRAIRKGAGFDPFSWAQERVPVFCRNIAAMHAAGVKIGVGTDAGGQTGYNYEGYNTPWEISSLVRCGLSPLEALTAATGTNAEILGVEDRLGVLQPGKIADLLVLAKDPLADIDNLRAIDFVMQGGVLHLRAEFAYRPRP